MKKFEYVELNDLSQEQLNEVGLEGWELISVVSVFSGVSFYFKREIENINSDKKETFSTEEILTSAQKIYPGQKLQQVKFIKETLNIGLKEAKDLVDNYWDRHQLKYSYE